jgi:hypothetical protein
VKKSYHYKKAHLLDVLYPGVNFVAPVYFCNEVSYYYLYDYLLPGLHIGDYIYVRIYSFYDEEDYVEYKFNKIGGN